MRSRLAVLLASRRAEAVITALIVVNAIVLGLETVPAAMAAAGPLLIALDQAILAVFVIEILARILVHRGAFFRDPWSLFDFTIVAISLVPAGEGLQVLRALRILRVLRLISTVPSLRRVVGGLVAALPGMGSIFTLLLLVYYVFSVMATKLYGATFPEWFGDLGASAYSLFQIMTLESWSMGIVRPVMEVHPWAWTFFVPWILCTTFTVLNLFIGVIVSAMQTEHDNVADAARDHIQEETSLVLAEVRRLNAELADVKQMLASRRTADGGAS